MPYVITIDYALILIKLFGFVEILIIIEMFDNKVMLKMFIYQMSGESFSECFN